MDYTALKALLSTYPEALPADNETLKAWVNELVVSKDRETLPATLVLSAILTYRDEWAALTPANQTTVRDILTIASGEGVPTGVGNPIRAELVRVLGPQTKTLLASKISYLISRAENAGILGEVTVGDIGFARTL